MAGQRYLLGTNKAYVILNSPLVSGVLEAKDIEMLKAFVDDPVMELPTGLAWTAPKIPGQILSEILGIIKAFPNNEVQVYLLYNFTRKEWKSYLPKQAGTPSFVTSQDDRDDMDGFALVGMVHSHPNMRAFWSSTDMRTNKEMGGIHMVFGTQNGEAVQHMCTFFGPGFYHDIEIDSVVDFPEDLDAFLKNIKAPEDWIRQLTDSFEEAKRKKGKKKC